MPRMSYRIIVIPELVQLPLWGENLERIVLFRKNEKYFELNLTILCRELLLHFFEFEFGSFLNR